MIQLIIAGVFLCAVTGQALTDCDSACVNKRYGDPVCGSDWNTYRYECELTKEACAMKKALIVVYKGECIGTSTGGVRFDRRGSIDGCNAIKCSSAYEPVCGSDGERYSNECHLVKHACFSKTAIIKVMRIGYQKSVCTDTPCPQCNGSEGIILCGSDGVTYGSLCHIRKKACEKKKAIVALYMGPCRGFSK